MTRKFRLAVMLELVSVVKTLPTTELLEIATVGTGINCTLVELYFTRNVLPWTFTKAPAEWLLNVLVTPYR